MNHLRQLPRLLLLTLLSAFTQAHAANYVFPGTLPVGCSGSGPSYTCSALTLTFGDTITVNAPTPATITINGNFSTNNAKINASGNASNLNLVVNGTLTAAYQANINGAVTAGAITSDSEVVFGRTLTATSGAIDLGYKTTVAGAIASDSGAITIGVEGSVGGAISSNTGAITVGQKVPVQGAVSTNGNVVIDNEAVVNGSVSAGSGALTLNYKANVSGTLTTTTGAISTANQVVIGGAINSTSGSVTLGQQVTVGSITTSGTVEIGNVTKVSGSISAGSNTVTMNYQSQVTGSVTSTTGTIDIAGEAVVGACVRTSSTAPNKIKLAYHAQITGVCCGTSCSDTCVANNTSYSMPAACAPAPLTCAVDNFSTGTLNTSLWNPITLGGSFLPQVVDVSGQKRLRLTTANTSQATAVQLKKWFPGAGNKIVVQFDYYSYGGNGGDGVGVVLSDADVPPAVGGNGGSLGYAQKTGTNGYAGGWLGVGIDEYGNYPRSTEGRLGYPPGWTRPSGAGVAAGFYPNSVAVRGSGSGTSGYRLLANTGTLSPEIWDSSKTSASLQKYRITVDNSNSVNAYVTVERDTSGTGSSYTTVIPQFDARAASGQAAVPANWLVSFTGGTGANINIHELANVSICATYMNEPGGSSNASAFECLETGSNLPWSASARKPLYTKRAGVDFTVDVAALKSDGTLESNYIAAGGNSKTVRVELFNDSVSPVPVCSAYSNSNLVASQDVTFASGSYSGAAGRVRTNSFNIAATYAKLRCRVKECTDSSCSSFTSVAPACSSDQFSVRPSAVTLATSASAAAPLTTATPAIRAGTNFSLAASTTPTTYAGSLAINTGKLTAQTTAQASSQASGGVVGSLAANTLTANAAAINTTYSEVGYLYLAPGAYSDDTLTAVDAAQGDCVTDTTDGNNLSDVLSGGKYGCSVGNTATVSLGRFYPDHFAIASPVLTPFCSATSSSFTYFGQDGFGTGFTMTAQNASNGTTQNYRGVFAKFLTTDYGNYGFTAATLPTGSALQASATGPTGTWTNGVATIAARHQVSRPTNPTAETLLTVSAAPTDGEVPASAATAVGSNVRMRYGRLRMQNAYGSERLNLPVPLEAQYWNGTYYTTNTDDSCTTLPVNSIVMSNFTANLSACETKITAPTGTATLASGRISNGVILAASGSDSAGVANSGSVDLAVNVTASAAGNTCVGPTSSAASAANRPWFGPNIGARATFGVYRSPLIYLRENY